MLSNIQILLKNLSGTNQFIEHFKLHFSFLNIGQFSAEGALQEKEFKLASYGKEICYIYNISVSIFIIGKHWELL